MNPTPADGFETPRTRTTLRVVLLALAAGGSCTEDAERPRPGAAGASGTAGAAGATMVGGAGGSPVAGAGGSSGGAGGAAAGQGGSAGSVGSAGSGGMMVQTAPVDQTTPGSKAPLALLDNFDGLSVQNPSDLSIAVGPNHIVQTVNWSMAVYTKKGAMYDNSGTVLSGPVSSNRPFQGAGGQCEAGAGDPARDRGDVVVRYDQLAQRWVFLQPVLVAPYAMCYAVSQTADPLGAYYHYEFERELFPDYPRLGMWPDGYYVGTSTGDEVIEKHICVADRVKMLAGQPATEQCDIVDGVNFLNPADLEGTTPPPAGAPNIVMAIGGTQLDGVYEDDGVYAYEFHVDWANPESTVFSGPTKIAVGPYHYLCDGQLTSCVTQPNTQTRLDAQGDKLMQRLVYRNFGDHQSLVATHSVDAPSGGGGLRWYEFRLDQGGTPALLQQSTYAPDTSYRWLGSISIDGRGNIGIGFSFGGVPNYPGQRFVARAAGDELGLMTFQETVLAEGEASQTNTLRWEDYTTTVVDPADDATFWYVGNYLKSGNTTTPATRIGSFRVP